MILIIIIVNQTVAYEKIKNLRASNIKPTLRYYLNRYYVLIYWPIGFWSFQKIINVYTKLDKAL